MSKCSIFLPLFLLASLPSLPHLFLPSSLPLSPPSSSPLFPPRTLNTRSYQHVSSQKGKLHAQPLGSDINFTRAMPTHIRREPRGAEKKKNKPNHHQKLLSWQIFKRRNGPLNAGRPGPGRDAPPCFHVAAREDTSHRLPTQLSALPEQCPAAPPSTPPWKGKRGVAALCCGNTRGRGR